MAKNFHNLLERLFMLVFLEIRSFHLIRDRRGTKQDREDKKFFIGTVCRALIAGGGRISDGEGSVRGRPSRPSSVWTWSEFTNYVQPSGMESKYKCIRKSTIWAVTHFTSIVATTQPRTSHSSRNEAVTCGCCDKCICALLWVSILWNYCINVFVWRL